MTILQTFSTNWAISLVINLICISGIWGATFDNEVISDEVTLQQSDSPHYVRGMLDIEPGGSLIVEPGTEVLFSSNGGLNVTGQLIVNGTEKEPVLFDLWRTDDDPGDNRTAAVRFRDTGQTMRRGTGVLEYLESDGSYHPMCDYRLSSPSSYAGTLQNLASTICYELGYPVVPIAAVSAFKDTSGRYAYRYRFDCPAGPSLLSECSKISDYCDTRSYSLFVDCQPPMGGREDYWNGIIIHVDNEQKSTLNHINIFNGGSGFSQRAGIALDVNGETYLRFIGVHNASGDGIVIRNTYNQVQLRNITVANCHGNGIKIESQLESMDVDGVEVRENINGLTVLGSKETIRDGIDLCALTCLVCDELMGIQSNIYRYHSPRSTTVMCTKGFIANEEEVILFRPIYAAGEMHIVVKDGVTIDSPVLFSGKIQVGQLSQYMPAVVSTTNGIIITVTDDNYYENEFIFELRHQSPDILVQKYLHINAINNTGKGFSIENTLLPIEMNHVVSTGNRIGIYVNRVASLSATLTDMQVHDNSEQGLHFNNIEGIMNIHRSNISRNIGYGITVDNTYHCAYPTADSRYVTDLVLQELTLDNNHNGGVRLNMHCSARVRIEDSQLSHGQSGVTYTNSYDRSEKLSLFVINRNIFSHISIGAIEVVVTKSMSVTITDNQVLSGNGWFVDFQSTSYYPRTIQLYIERNDVMEFTTKHSIISIRYDYESRAGGSWKGEVKIQENSFSNNSICFPLDYFAQTKNTIPAIVNLDLYTSVEMNNNIFQNPNSRYQLSIGGRYPSTIHDAEYNYWGAQSVDFIEDQIYRFRYSHLSEQVHYVPFLTDPTDMDSYNSSIAQEPLVLIGTNLAGIITDHLVLVNSIPTYNVIRDLVISPEGKLTVQSGIRLQFAVGTGVFNHGELELVGTQAKPIVLSSLNIETEEMVRLVNGEDDAEGFVQIKVDDEWLNTCYHSPSMDSLAFLCAAAGFADYISHEAANGSSAGEENEVVVKATCDTAHACDCTFLTNFTQCTAGNFYLRCQERYWEGVVLALDTKSAIISHVRIESYGTSSQWYGVQAGLAIDFLHSLISINDLFITRPYDADNKGIYIGRCDPYEEQIIRRVTIHHDANGHAIQINDPRITLEDITMTGSPQTYGIWIYQQAPSFYALHHTNARLLCSSTHLELTGDSVIYLRAYGSDLVSRTSCVVNITSDPLTRIMVNVITGVIDSNCDSYLTFVDPLIEMSTRAPAGFFHNPWISSGNEIQISMYQYHYTCLSSYIRVQAITKDSESDQKIILRNINLSTFKEGILIQSSLIPGSLQQITINNTASYGVRIYHCQGDYNVTRANIGHTDVGLVFDSLNGEARVTDSEFTYAKRYGVYVYLYNLIQNSLIHVRTCGFFGNRGSGVALIGPTYSYDPNRKDVELIVEGSLFENNEHTFTMNTYKTNYRTEFYVISIINNQIKANSYGIKCDEGNTPWDSYRWLISGNTFNGGHNALVNIWGHGIIESNTFTNWTMGSSGLAAIVMRDSDQMTETCTSAFISNQITDVKSNVKLVLLSSSCNIIQIENNTIQDSQTGSSVVELHVRKTHFSRSSANITNNALENDLWADGLDSYTVRKTHFSRSSANITNNALENNELIETLIIGCKRSYTFRLIGFVLPVCKYNILKNPDLDYEILVPLDTTLDDTAVLDLSYNYWGVTDPAEIARRIGHIDDDSSRIGLDLVVVPWYQSPSMEEGSLDNRWPENLFLVNNKLGGRITESTILDVDAIYILSSNLLIPSHVTLSIPEGVVIEMASTYSVIVNGRLEVNGKITNPVTIRQTELLQSAAATNATCLRDAQLLSPVGLSTEGRIEVEDGGGWTSICDYEWTAANAEVACRQFGLGEVVTYRKNYDYVSNIGSLAFSCEGHEDHLFQCHVYRRSGSCSRSRSVGFQCSQYRGGIFFTTRSEVMVSTLTNVVFEGIDRIEISGIPPNIDNIAIHDSSDGMTFIGSGLAKETDILIKNSDFANVDGTAISLYDITANVTIETASLSQIREDGIHFSPSLIEDNIIIDYSRHWSTFRFCDAKTQMYIEPGEVFKFFRKSDYNTRSCRRVFFTDEFSSIYLYLIPRSIASDGVNLVNFYEGMSLDLGDRIQAVYSVRNSEQPITVQSWKTALTVELIEEEYDFNYAFVTSVPEKALDCSFEDGTCGWSAADDPYSVTRGGWHWYDCNSLNYIMFYGMERDITFSGGTDGHYIYAGVNEGTGNCDQYQLSYHARSEDAILESPRVTFQNNFCRMSFYYYRRGVYTNTRGEKLSVFINDGDSLLSRFSSTSYNNQNNKWFYAEIDLWADGLDSYTVVFHAKYTRGCSNSVGIDNIQFHQCLQEKFTSTISLTEVSMTNIQRQPVTIRNDDPLKHNIIWIERCSIQNSFYDYLPTSYAISLHLKSAYVLIRNLDIVNIEGNVLSISFNSETDKRIVEATLVQNSIWNCPISQILHIENNGIKPANIYLINNDIRYNAAPEEAQLIQVTNTTLLMEGNILFNNIGGYILQVDTLADNLTAQIVNNTFWFNAAQRLGQKYVIAINVTDLDLQDNLLNNPASDFDLGVLSPLNEQPILQCSNNWWGSGIQDKVSSRIYDGNSIDGLPSVTYLPYRAAIPLFFGISGSCDVGWIRESTRCLLYRGGAVDHTTATAACELEGATLLTSNLAYKYRKTIVKISRYRDVDGTQKYATIWIGFATGKSDSSNNAAKECRTFAPNTASQKFSRCESLRPYICQKLTVNECPDSCFNNGICSGTKCRCDDGWDGDNCSSFHCRDVADCSGRGECVGPNQCLCRDGWRGSACTTSQCTRFDSCKTCAPKDGCGWCDEQSLCLPGTAFETDIGTCETWFYRSCLTIEGNSSCSSQISQFSCSSRYCNEENKDFNRVLCQRCQERLDCYKPTSVNLNGETCLVLNESKCPFGKAESDYTDQSRINNTVFSDNFVGIDPDEAVIYTCDSTLNISASRRLDVMLTNSDLEIQADHIIASPQAGGIFHKIEGVIDIGSDIKMFAGRTAKLEEALQFADFNFSVEGRVPEDETTLDQYPDDNIIEGLENGTLEVTNRTLHELPASGVHKCVGHLYESSNGAKAISYYIVIETSALQDDIEVGHGVFSSYSDGFLETVEKTVITDEGAFIFTTLTQCSSEVTLAGIRTDKGYPSMSCVGGDLRPGVSYFDTDPGFQQEEVIIGRDAGAVLGQVINTHEDALYTLLEVVPVFLVVDGDLVLPLPLEELNTLIRKKRVTVREGFKANDRKKISAKEGPVTITVGADYDLDLSLYLVFGWGIFSPQLEEAGFTLKGSTGVDGTIDLYAKASGSANGPVGDYNSPGGIPFAILFIPGRVTFGISGSYKASVTAEVEAQAYYRASFDFSASSHWRRGTGATSFNPTVTPSSEDSYSGEVKLEASATLTVTPSATAQWPIVPITRKKKKRNKGGNNEEKVPDKINDRFEGTLAYEKEEPKPEEKGLTIDGEAETLDSFTSLEVGLNLPVSLTLSGKGCDISCGDPKKLTNLKLSVSLDGICINFRALKWGYNACLRGGWSAPLAQKCFPNYAPCCLCEDEDGTLKPGVPNPKDPEECMCPCFCDPPDNTIESYKPKDGECQCDLCPDEKTFKRKDEEIECPCTCPDKPDEEKEMSSDGTCDCECECPDGSKERMEPDGNCPCECECENCEKSTLGPDGCICPDDTCPPCEEGSSGYWVDCECECPGDCGSDGVCADGRKGPDCNIPDCPSDCNGNGNCQLGSGCSSNCDCTAQWQGTSCDERVPRRRSGDPHMETVDGQMFDYFGIGQFQDCLSEENDFGYQVRFFYYKTTSFTGAVAVKAGTSVVTITTPETATILTNPTLRFDGIIQDLSASFGTRLSSSTVKVDVTIPDRAQNEDDTAVLLLTITFQNRASIGFDVRFSPTMARQYINIVYQLTAKFLHKTSGLCGVMDDTMENDLTGSDGVIYTLGESDNVVETWRIPQMIRAGAGMSNSWSWTESNFHPDDPVGNSYTDPTFTPSYSLDGFSTEDIYAGTMLCSALGITGDLLDGCIYDVVITGDLTMIDQEVLKTGCRGGCSGHGRCGKRNTCVCQDDWSGEDCSVGDCGTCHQGDCISGFCQCYIGWEGITCDEEATCSNVNNCTDLQHGTCQTTDKCLCVEGYIGSDCSQIPTCFNVANCSSQGVCVDIDVCSCHTNWKGSDCTEPSCEELAYCSGNGQCVAYRTCLCNDGWTGPSCSIPGCTAVNYCSGRGVCAAPNKCNCVLGTEGANCGINTDCPSLDNCNNRGLCAFGRNTLEDETEPVKECRCDIGYSGEACDSVACDLVNNCSSNGECIQPNQCLCQYGYQGNDCSAFSCEKLDHCSGNGDCIDFDVCSCNAGWTGESCETADCGGVGLCSSQGLCISPNHCYCYDGFDGANCSQPLEDNQNAPVMLESRIFLSMRENTASGISLFVFNATDEDDGRNGELRFSLDYAQSGFDLGEYVTIDSLTGALTLLKPIPRSVVPSGAFNFSVVVLDQGIPQRQSQTLVSVTVDDVNDNCPQFTLPVPGTTISVNVSIQIDSSLVSVVAEDEDFDENGEVTLSLVNNGNLLYPYIKLDTDGKVKTTFSPLPVGKYNIEVDAKDGGLNPCSTKLTLPIDVYPDGVEKATTTTTTTTTTTQTTVTVVPVSQTAAAPRDDTTLSQGFSTEPSQKVTQPLPETTDTTGKDTSTKETTKGQATLTATTKSYMETQSATSSSTLRRSSTNPSASTTATTTTSTESPDGNNQPEFSNSVTALGALFGASLVVNLILAGFLCRAKLGKGARDPPLIVQTLPNQVSWDDQVIYQQGVIPRQRPTYKMGNPW